MIAGYKGLSITGEKYRYHLIASFDPNRLLLIIKHIKTALLEHLMAVMLLFSVPIAIIINSLACRSEQPRKLKLLILYSLSCFISLLFFTSFTTTEIVGWNQYESLNRIHMRYYTFMFPLFFIITISESSYSFLKKEYWKTAIVLTTFFGMTIYAILFLRKQYIISFIDCPELFGIVYNESIFKGLSLFSIVCLIVWTIRKKWGAILYIYLFLPLTMLTSNYFVNVELRQERLYHTDVYDRAGRFVHDYLGGETSHLVVIAPEQAGLAKILFYLDNPHVSKSELPINFPIEFAKIPQDRKWVLFIGNYLMLRKPYLIISMGDFTLIKL